MTEQIHLLIIGAELTTEKASMFEAGSEKLGLYRF
jgi:hypothetical protein